MSLALCSQVVSEASQHLRSSEKQAVCEGCFAQRSICLVVSLHFSMPRAVHPQEWLQSANWFSCHNYILCILVSFLISFFQQHQHYVTIYYFYEWKGDFDKSVTFIFLLSILVLPSLTRVPICFPSVLVMHSFQCCSKILMCGCVFYFFAVDRMYLSCFFTSSLMLCEVFSLMGGWTEVYWADGHFVLAPFVSCVSLTLHALISLKWLIDWFDMVKMTFFLNGAQSSMRWLSRWTIWRVVYSQYI